MWKKVNNKFAIAICAILIVSTSKAQQIQNNTKVSKMNAEIDVFFWIQNKTSIATAKIISVDSEDVSPGKRKVIVKIAVEDVLWRNGVVGNRFEFLRPESDVAFLKFPDPIWGRVEAKVDSHLFLVVNPELGNAIYVDAIDDPKDAVLQSVRTILSAENQASDLHSRWTRYLGYVDNGTIVASLFGAKTIANSPELLNVNMHKVVASFTHYFNTNKDDYGRISIGSWLWNDVYPKCEASDQIIIIKSVIQALNDNSTAFRRFSLDRLSSVDPSILKGVRIEGNEIAVKLLRERFAKETSPNVCVSLQRLIDVLKEE